MKYLNTKEIALLWDISERTVRDYCAKGRVNGAIMVGKSWLVPSDASKPERLIRQSTKPQTLLAILKEEKSSGYKGGIYNKMQVDFTYNSNHIEGSTLTHDETRYIFETNTIGIDNKSVNVDDIIETVNHFRCIDLVIDQANATLTENLIKQLHGILKGGTNDSRKAWFKVGDYKQLDNEVGGEATTKVENVKEEMKKLLNEYNSLSKITIGDIIEFHKKFESIHPFQDGNGRVGRLIMLKECLKNNIVPILITDSNKMFYYRGLKEWNKEKGYLIDTCLAGQDLMKSILDYFKINY